MHRQVPGSYQATQCPYLEGFSKSKSTTKRIYSAFKCWVLLGKERKKYVCSHTAWIQTGSSQTAAAHSPSWVKDEFWCCFYPTARQSQDGATNALRKPSTSRTTAFSLQVDIREAVLEVFLCSITLFTKCSHHFIRTKNFQVT